MDSLLPFTPIQRQLFKDVSDIERSGNSCVISFSRPRRRGRHWVATAICIGAVLLVLVSLL